MPALILHPIDEIIAEITAGRMVIVVDDPGRENEADLVAAAAKVTPEMIAFMANHGTWSDMCAYYRYKSP